MVFLSNVRKEFNTMLRCFDLNKVLYSFFTFFVSAILVFFNWKFLEDVLAKLNEQIQNIDKAGLQNLNILDTANNAIVQSSVQNIIFKMIFAFLLFMVFLFLIWTVTQLTIWLIITSTNLFKQGWKRVLVAYVKFLSLNLLWFLVWLLPLVFAFVFLANSSDPELVGGTRVFMRLIFLFIVGIFTYFTTISFYNFAKSRKIWKSFSLAFMIGFSKIKYFLLPGVFAILILLLFNVITLPFSRTLPVFLFNFVYIAFYFIFSAWMKLYFGKIIAKVQKKYPELSYEERSSSKKKR